MSSQENRPLIKGWQIAFWPNRRSVIQLRGITRWEAGEVDRLAQAVHIKTRTAMPASNFMCFTVARSVVVSSYVGFLE